jgi:hypothetical protein
MPSDGGRLKDCHHPHDACGAEKWVSQSQQTDGPPLFTIFNLLVDLPVSSLIGKDGESHGQRCQRWGRETGNCSRRGPFYSSTQRILCGSHFRLGSKFIRSSSCRQPLNSRGRCDASFHHRQCAGYDISRTPKRILPLVEMCLLRMMKSARQRQMAARRLNQLAESRRGGGKETIMLEGSTRRPYLAQAACDGCSQPVGLSGRIPSLRPASTTTDSSQGEFISSSGAY